MLVQSQAETLFNICLPSSTICSHFHMLNIHISCLPPGLLAVTALCSLSLGLRALGHFILLPLSHPTMMVLGSCSLSLGESGPHSPNKGLNLASKTQILPLCWVSPSSSPFFLLAT